MLKKVKIDISSSLYELDDLSKRNGEPERESESAIGTLKYDGIEIRISYKNFVEGAQISSQIVALGKEIIVKRSGAIISEMIFNCDEVYKTLYRIPPYAFDMEIKTESIKNDLSASGGTLEVKYTIDVGGAKKSAEMSITVSEV